MSGYPQFIYVYMYMLCVRKVKITLISDVIKNRDSDLFNRITSATGHVLYDLLPPKRNRALRKRGHDFILPKVKTERLKRAFGNRCLLNLFLKIFLVIHMIGFFF